MTKLKFEIEFNTVYPESPEEDINWLCADNLALILNKATNNIHKFKARQLY